MGRLGAPCGWRGHNFERFTFTPAGSGKSSTAANSPTARFSYTQALDSHGVYCLIHSNSGRLPTTTICIHERKDVNPAGKAAAPSFATYTPPARSMRKSLSAPHPADIALMNLLPCKPSYTRFTRLPRDSTPLGYSGGRIRAPASLRAPERTPWPITIRPPAPLSSARRVLRSNNLFRMRLVRHGMMWPAASLPAWIRLPSRRPGQHRRHSFFQLDTE